MTRETLPEHPQPRGQSAQLFAKTSPPDPGLKTSTETQVCQVRQASQA